MTRTTDIPACRTFTWGKKTPPISSYAGTPRANTIEYFGSGHLTFNNACKTHLFTYDSTRDIQHGYIKCNGTSQLYLKYLEDRYSGFTFTRIKSTASFAKKCFGILSDPEVPYTLIGAFPPRPNADQLARKKDQLSYALHPANVMGIGYTEYYGKEDFSLDLAKWYRQSRYATYCAAFNRIYPPVDSTDQVENEMKEKKEKEEGHEM